MRGVDVGDAGLSHARPSAAGHSRRRPLRATPLVSGASTAGLAIRPRDGVLRPLHRPHSAWRWQRRWHQRSVMQILLPISSRWIGRPSVPTAQSCETPLQQRLPSLPSPLGWRCCRKFQPNDPRTVARVHLTIWASGFLPAEFARIGPAPEPRSLKRTERTR